MIQDDIDYVKECIKNNEVHRFYIWSKWLRVRKEILKRDHNECVVCVTNVTKKGMDIDKRIIGQH